MPVLPQNHKPRLITGAAIGLIATGFFILSLTYLPIMLVEARYQTLETLESLFGTQNIARIFIPHLSFSFKSRSKYQEYGITIPTLHLDEPVVFNVDPNDTTAYTQALKKGIAHASGTAFPDSGGLGYYFAHSSNPEFKNQYNAIFYLLGKLKTGDDVYIWHEGKASHYQVTYQQVTDPTDTAFLYNQTYDQETIVLQTCWPPGTTQKRLLVFATLILDR